MRIQEIYDHFYVPYGVQRHMIMVASVAKTIIDSRCWSNIDWRIVLKWALLHNIGQIAKMDFYWPHHHFYKDNMEYWSKKKVEMMNQYWSKIEDMTHSMLSELWIDNSILSLIENVGIKTYLNNNNAQTNLSIERSIIRYSDMRVCPTGIVSLEERLLDWQKRYSHEKRSKEENFATIIKNAKSEEELLFSWSVIQPENITDESTKLIQDFLRTYDMQLWT